MRSNNILSFKQRVQLADWLRRKEKAGELDGCYVSFVAETATKVLGFDITDNNIQYMRSELGISWEKPKNTPPNNSSRITRVEMRLGVLESAVNALLKKLGEEPLVKGE